MSHTSCAPVPVDDRKRCLELCRTDDPGEYPLFENVNMDAFLIQVGRHSTSLYKLALSSRAF